MAFTAPRGANRRSWLYRIRPAAVHQPFRRIDNGRLTGNFAPGHDPDAESFEKASNADTSKPDYVTDTMAFMFETPAVIRPTRFALETCQRQTEYFQRWQGLAKHFDPGRR